MCFRTRKSVLILGWIWILAGMNWFSFIVHALFFFFIIYCLFRGNALLYQETVEYHKFIFS